MIGHWPTMAIIHNNFFVSAIFISVINDQKWPTIFATSKASKQASQPSNQTTNQPTNRGEREKKNVRPYFFFGISAILICLKKIPSSSWWWKLVCSNAIWGNKQTKNSYLKTIYHDDKPKCRRSSCRSSHTHTRTVCMISDRHLYIWVIYPYKMHR